MNRNTACWFPRTFINSKGFEQLAVHINGSSKHAAIKPFDQLFTPHSIGKPDLTQHWNNAIAQSWHWKESCYFSILNNHIINMEKKTEAVIQTLTRLKHLTEWFGNVGACPSHGKMFSGLVDPIHQFSNSYLSCWFPSPSCDYSNLRHILLRVEFSPVENNCTTKRHSSAYCSDCYHETCVHRSYTRLYTEQFWGSSPRCFSSSVQRYSFSFSILWLLLQS